MGEFLASRSLALFPLISIWLMLLLHLISILSSAPALSIQLTSSKSSQPFSVGDKR